MWASAEIDKIAVAIKRNFFVGRNVFDDVEFVSAGLGSFAQTGEPALLSEFESFVA